MSKATNFNSYFSFMDAAYMHAFKIVFNTSSYIL